jgi:hypothetical protein
MSFTLELSTFDAKRDQFWSQMWYFIFRFNAETIHHLLGCQKSPILKEKYELRPNCNKYIRKMLYGTNSDLKKRKNYTLINLLLLFYPYRSSYFTTTTPCMVMLSCLSFAYLSYQIAVLFLQMRWSIKRFDGDLCREDKMSTEIVQSFVVDIWFLAKIGNSIQIPCPLEYALPCKVTRTSTHAVHGSN